MKYKEVLLGDIADVQWGDTTVTKAKYISDSGYKAFSASGCDGKLPYFDFDREGVVLSAIGAACGKIWYTSGKWSSIKNTIHFWSKNEDVVLTKYLAYAINPKKWIISGSAQPFITLQNARKYRIRLPDAKTQQKIVRILSALDNKIELNTQQNETLEKTASELINSFQCGQKQTIKLSDIMFFDNGYAFKSRDYVSKGKYKIITIKNVKDGSINSEGAQCLEFLPKDIKKHHRLGVGDILLSLTGNVGRAGIVFENDLLLNQRVAKVHPKNEVLRPFLYFTFRQEAFKSELENLAKGTAQLNLSPVETLNQKIPYEERAVVELNKKLYPLFEKIISNKQQSKQLSNIRDVLLLRLLDDDISLREGYI